MNSVVLARLVRARPGRRMFRKVESISNDKPLRLCAVVSRPSRVHPLTINFHIIFVGSLWIMHTLAFTDIHCEEAISKIVGHAKWVVLCCMLQSQRGQQWQLPRSVDACRYRFWLSEVHNFILSTLVPRYFSWTMIVMNFKSRLNEMQYM